MHHTPQGRHEVEPCWVSLELAKQAKRPTLDPRPPNYPCVVVKGVQCTLQHEVPIALLCRITARAVGRCKG
jgi:hypothetical protein